MKRHISNLLIAVFVVGSAIGLLAKKKEEPLATLNFVVVRDENGEPVRNAAVVLHPVDEDGTQSRGGLELKTNPDGKTSYDGVPYGTLRIQVLARGFQTYGEDFQINQPSQEITIKLKRPAKQYTIYNDTPKSQNNNSPSQPSSPPDKKPQN